MSRNRESDWVYGQVSLSHWQMQDVLSSEISLRNKQLKDLLPKSKIGGRAMGR